MLVYTHIYDLLYKVVRGFVALFSVGWVLFDLVKIDGWGYSINSSYHYILYRQFFRLTVSIIALYGAGSMATACWTKR